MKVLNTVINYNLGLGCFISGLIGPGVGITTHAENVGVIGITRACFKF